MENYLLPHSKPENRSAISAFAKLIPNHKKHPNSDYIDQIKNEIEQWNIPSLVIFPDGDMAWKPDEGEKIINFLLDSEFYLIKNAGHYIQEDAGEEMAELIIKFLKRN